MQVIPLEDRVLVKIEEEESRTKSGLYIPDTAKEKPQQGVVVAVGDDELVKVKVGDRVLFAKFSGNEISLDGADHLILDQSDLLAIVRN